MERMSSKDFRAKLESGEISLNVKSKKKTTSKTASGLDEESKYGNKIVYHDGIKFHSKRERDRYIELKLLERAGLITELRLQVKFVLTEAAVIDDSGSLKSPIRYFADFTYVDVKSNELVVEDVKSPVTRKKPEYRMKKHLMVVVHNIRITEIF